MINMSQEYFNAAISSLLQQIADMASKSAHLAGQLAESQASAEQLKAKIAEIEKSTPLKAVSGT